jgi:hypothetical protein
MCAKINYSGAKVWCASKEIMKKARSDPTIWLLGGGVSVFVCVLLLVRGDRLIIGVIY